MSIKLINHNADLRKLRDEGYEIEVRDGYLVVHAVPYVTADRSIALATLVTNLELSNETTDAPKSHQIWFSGEFPCNADGSAITALGSSTVNQTLCSGVTANFQFSCKPKDGYPDYHAKMTRYIDIVSHPAQAIDSNVTARTYKPRRTSEDESVFVYEDTASSKDGIVSIGAKLAMKKIAFVGLGGTGAYALDLVAKTPVCEIHLFDGDLFANHNAFRAPGAASFEQLDARPSKVAYLAGVYSQMRRGIVPHEEFIDEESIEQLADFDFVFLCVDKSAVRKLVWEFLKDHNIPFVDTGMRLSILEEAQSLRGTCRVTLCAPGYFDHLPSRASFEDVIEDDIYDSNIQVADMNAFNAALAVIKWKKYCHFYRDSFQEHHSAYAISPNNLTNDVFATSESE